MTTEIITKTDERFVFEDVIDWNTFKKDVDTSSYPQILDDVRQGFFKLRHSNYRLIFAYDTFGTQNAPVGYAIITINNARSTAVSIVGDAPNKVLASISYDNPAIINATNPNHYAYITDVRVAPGLDVQSTLLQELIARSDALIRQNQVLLTNSQELLDALAEHIENIRVIKEAYQEKVRARRREDSRSFAKDFVTSWSEVARAKFKRVC